MNDFSVNGKQQNQQYFTLTIMYIPVRPARRNSDEDEPDQRLEKRKSHAETKIPLDCIPHILEFFTGYLVIFDLLQQIMNFGLRDNGYCNMNYLFDSPKNIQDIP